MAAVTDTLFGTRLHTEGAHLQRPRKVPLRIEPKSFFANERTFLSWLHMAITMGGITTALAGYSVQSANAVGAGKGPISKLTTDLISCILLPISILMVAYALFTFYWRSRCMERKQTGFFNDQIGPVVVAVLIMSSLIFIASMAFHDMLTR